MNLLSDPSDVRRLMSAFRTTYEIATSPAAGGEVSEVIFPPERLDDDAELERWLRENVTTGFHGAGTCRMGPDGDAGAVVTERLAVRGTEGLYVADASIMPEITNGYTNIACYMIGERGAEWLKRPGP